eukprot:g4575.t1
MEELVKLSEIATTRSKVEESGKLSEIALVHPSPSKRWKPYSAFWENLDDDSCSAWPKGVGSGSFFENYDHSELISDVSSRSSTASTTSNSSVGGSVGLSSSDSGSSFSSGGFTALQRRIVAFDYDCPLLSKVVAGLQAGVIPTPVDSICAGGAYFLRSPGKRIAAVFKPMDEEPYAANNPKSYKPRRLHAPDKKGKGDGSLMNDLTSLESGKSLHCQVGMKRGIQVGKGAVRECAAFLLDSTSTPPKFCGVPETFVVTVKNTIFNNSIDTPVANVKTTKTGSLQQYIKHFCSAEDMAPHMFDVDSVQRIAIFDIRTFNTDRHSGNILVSHFLKTTLDRNRSNSFPSMSKCKTNGEVKSKMKLVPIDHSFCLPRVDCLNDVTLDWINWPQSEEPLGKNLVEYIKNLDGKRDVAMLIDVLNDAIEPMSLRTLRVGTRWLQIGTEAGVTLKALGSAMSTKHGEHTSIVGAIVARALAAEREKAGEGQYDEETFFSTLDNEMYRVIHGLKNINSPLEKEK